MLEKKKKNIPFFDAIPIHTFPVTAIILVRKKKKKKKKKNSIDFFQKSLIFVYEK